MDNKRPGKPRAVKVQFRTASPSDPAPKVNNSPRPGVKPPPRNAAPIGTKRSAVPDQKQSVKNPVPGQKQPAKNPASKPPVKRAAHKRADSRAELNRKISTQTPANREQAHRVKKIGGSSKNIEIKRRQSSAKQRFYVKKKRTNLIKLLAARLILFLVMFALMFGVVAGVFNMRLKAGGVEKGISYTLQLGEDKPEDDESDYEPEYIEIPEGCAQRNGTVYIPVSALIDLCSLTVTGSYDNLRYIPRDSGGHTMSFNVGSELAYVNKTVVRMKAPSFISQGKLYVPLDFFLNYAEGLVIDEDSVNAKITIYRLNTGYDALTDTKLYAPLTFKASDVAALEPIAEPADIE